MSRSDSNTVLYYSYLYSFNSANAENNRPRKGQKKKKGIIILNTPSTQHYDNPVIFITYFMNISFQFLVHLFRLDEILSCCVKIFLQL